MTVLMIHGTATVPMATRTVLVMGANSPTTTAIVDITNASRLMLTANTTTATGLIDHGLGPTPVVVKLDRASLRHDIVTDRETIGSTYTTLGSSRGLTIGGAVRQAANSRWLYMAAWYGTKAEIADAEISSLLKAMGW